MRLLALLPALLLALTVLSEPCDAQADQAVLQRGRAIAEQKCSACHAIGAEAASPTRVSPPFRTLHEQFPVDMLVAALRSGVISGHDEMPMFTLPPPDMLALIGYIDSLAPPASRYLSTPAKR